ncbi:C25 family cysteine peptidase [Infirmifilum sp. SLHALR2]
MKAPVEGYEVVSVVDTQPYLRPGAPIVPVKVIKFELPYHAEVLSVKVSYREAQLPGKHRLLPSPQPVRLDKAKNATAREVYVEDPKIYSSKAPYPGKVYEYEVHRGLNARGERATIVVVRIFPVQYVPAEGRISYISSAEVTVEYTSSEEPKPLLDLNLVIISPPELSPYANQLAEIKNQTGLKSIVVTTDWIYSNYQGVDKPEKIRNYLKDLASQTGSLYVILFGDTNLIPTRRVHWSGIEDYAWINPYVETDLYYADLDGSWNADGDSDWGEPGEDGVDGYPDIVVGRLPVRDEATAMAVVSKIAGYQPENSWFRRILLLGTVTFWDPLRPEGEITKDYIEQYALPEDFSWTKLYEGLGNLTRSNVIREISNGYGFVNFAGHGNTWLWWFGSWSDEGYFTSGDVFFFLGNGNKTAVVFASACLTNDFADTDVAISEAFILHRGGAIAYVGAAELAYAYIGYWTTYGLSNALDVMFIRSFKVLENATALLPGPSPGLMHALALEEYLSTFGTGWDLDWYTVVEYGSLIGDPSAILKGAGSPPPPPPEPVLRGWVLDPNQQPVAGAVVRLYDYFSGQLLYETVATDGYYEFRGISSGTYRLNASKGDAWGTRTFYYPRVPMTVNVTVQEIKLVPNTVLIVVDDDARFKPDEGFWPEEFEAVASSLGFSVFVWRESELGEPPLDMLLNANVPLVVWHSGTGYWWAVSPTEAGTLIQFVEAGGRLLLEGEDIGLDHGCDEFMVRVAHACYLVDNAGAGPVEATLLHPVTSGISVLAFSAQPPWPDGVYPVNGGVEVMRYTGTDYSAVVVYDGLPLGSNARVVYVAFPVHYLNASDRDALLRNALRWLSTSVYLVPRTDKAVYQAGSQVLLSATVYNASTPLPGLNVTAEVYRPDGSLLARVAMQDEGNGTYSGIVQIPSAAPIGDYLVRVYAMRAGEVAAYGQAAFKVVLNYWGLGPKFDVVSVLYSAGSSVLVVNASSEAGLPVLAVYYVLCSQGSCTGFAAQPADGSFGGAWEVVLLNISSSQLAVGEYSVYVYTDFLGTGLGNESEWLLLARAHVRELAARYNLIALSGEQLLPMRASDLAAAVGGSLQAVWKWDVSAQRFSGFIPGVSTPDKDFQLERGYGYFVYLTLPARWVEVNKG